MHSILLFVTCLFWPFGRNTSYHTFIEQINHEDVWVLLNATFNPASNQILHLEETYRFLRYGIFSTLVCFLKRLFENDLEGSNCHYINESGCWILINDFSSIKTPWRRRSHNIAASTPQMLIRINANARTMIKYQLEWCHNTPNSILMASHFPTLSVNGFTYLRYDLKKPSIENLFYKTEIMIYVTDAISTE